MYKNEKEMYPDVCSWFRKLLQDKFKDAEICVEDTSRKVLSKWLLEKGFHTYFSDYQTYEIEVDITGIIRKSTNENYLGFIECKIGKITLRDLSQLLGYSKVALPKYAIILSPKGVSQSLNLLFNINRREDILRYSPDNKHIFITTWLEEKKEIDFSTIIPKGSQII
jgi:aldehyde:ferredoxin oxidoreductase